MLIYILTKAEKTYTATGVGKMLRRIIEEWIGTIAKNNNSKTKIQIPAGQSFTVNDDFKNLWLIFMKKLRSDDVLK